MASHLIDRIQARLELFRLEKRYTRRRDRRSTFVSTATYVDGEYIYQTPASTGTSSSSQQSKSSQQAAALAALEGKSVKTKSSMSFRPNLGKSQSMGGGASATTDDVLGALPERPNKKLNRFSSMPGFGSTSGGGGGGRDLSKMQIDWAPRQRG